MYPVVNLYVLKVYNVNGVGVLGISTCAKLSWDKFKCLSNCSSCIRFYCSICHPKVDAALQFFYSTAKSMKLLSTKLQSLEDNVTKTTQSISSEVAKINDALKFKSSVSLETQVMECSTQVRSNHQASTSEIEMSLSSVLLEEKEISKQCLNLIIHNLDESSDPDGQTKKKDYMDRATSLVKEYLNVPVKVTNGVPLVKKGERQRLLKISLSSDKEKAQVLCNCTKLRNSSHPEYIRKICITPDLTPKQQQRNKALRARLAEMNKNGNQYQIKNSQIVQGQSRSSPCTPPNETVYPCFLTNARSILNKFSNLIP